MRRVLGRGPPGGDVSDWSCPVPRADRDTILLAHGGGGRLSRELLDEVFAPAFHNEWLATGHDGALLPAVDGPLAFTTDSFVVHPLFFPGGDIGALAVHGTVNDLAMCGARPRWLSVGFILEEGLPRATLERVVASMARAAAEAGVHIVTGDTKVVERGRADGLYVNTAGIGVRRPGPALSPSACRPGDRVLLSGPVGNHGVAVMSVREGLAFDAPVLSDAASLHGLAEALLDAGGDGVRVLRDPTRGGLATALVELATSSRVGVDLDEAAVPVDEPVRAACELLGLDPFYVANEGKLVAVVSPDRAADVLAAMRAHHLGLRSADIGAIGASRPGQVVAHTGWGGARHLDLLAGEQLPRIC